MEDFPHEITVNILGRLHIKDILNFGSTCKRNFECSRDLYLWAYLAEENFGYQR